MLRRPSALVIASVCTFALGQMASAADLPRKAPGPPPPPAYSWTGFYVGANVGGGWGDRDVSYSPNDPLMVFLFTPGEGGAPPPASFRSSGVLGGVQAGYNWQFNPSWLVGIETDFDWSNVKGSASSVGVIETVAPYTATVHERLKWFGTARARLGYLPMPNVLAYVTGGFAYGRIERTGTYTNNSTGPLVGNIGGFSFICSAFATCFAGSQRHTAVGWTLGGGLEYAIDRRWTVKAEYLYVSLDSDSMTETALLFAPGATPASLNANFDRFNFSVARVGANYRF